MLGTFFQCDPDLRLANSEIYLDPSESRPIGLISHGHSDHIGRHGYFYATEATAAFLRIREGHDLRGTTVRFGEEIEIDGWRASFHAAGHVLGSAMIRVSDGARSLLYTGDFKLRASLSCETVDVPPCDAVVMESTYGSPEWRFPSRDEVQSQLLSTVRQILSRMRTPVLLAYSLGKAQEAMAMLRESGLPVVVHPVVARVAEVYAKQGIDLGRYEVWAPQRSLFGNRSTTDVRGKVLVIAPHMKRDIRRVPGAETIALTGWALHRNYSDAHHGIPLSDHADFDELLELVERCGAKTVYVTHGSARFARELKARGHHAEFLRKKPQMRLF